jgi:CO/xanthine dehydrogenase FAD-binding subunit
MDLITVERIRVPRTRAELSFAPGELPLGGGTWLFSEAQPGVTGFVDLTGFDWHPVEETDSGLTISATCTIAELARLPHTPLFSQCANSLLASFKIWNVATVGGNICVALPAGPMTSLAAALEATAVIWTTDGGERRMPVAEFVTGVRQNALEPGEILRAIEFPRETLSSRTGFRRIALSPLGRTGTLVTARQDADGQVLVTVTGGTTHPHQLRFDELPSAVALADAVDRIDDWYSDPHGAPDWRHGMSRLFAEQLRVEFGGAA